MVKTVSELMEDIRTKLGEDTSDEALNLIENVNDTFNDLTNKAKNYNELEQKYKDNDASWRQKYRDRFFSSEANEEFEREELEDTRTTITKFEDLFKEG